MAELNRNQLVHVELGNFMIGQALMNIHAIWLWVGGLLIVGFFKTEKQYRPIAFMFAFAFILFIMGKAKDYYTLGLYPILFAVGAYEMEKYGQVFVKKAFPVLMIAIALPFIPIGLPVFNHYDMAAYFQKIKPIIGDGFLRWEDGKIHDMTQDYADMTGWKDMYNLVRQAYESLSEDEKTACVIYGENYGQAGAIAVFNKDKKLPYPISFSDNFLYWLPDSINVKAFIYMNDEEGDIHQLFNSVTLFGEVTTPFAREKGLKVYICREPKPLLYPFYKQKLESIKAKRVFK